MMDVYTATEISYKNGYDAGYKQGFIDGWNERDDQGAAPRMGVWKLTPDGTRVCSHCGMPESNCIPGGGAIYDREKNFCFKCGTRLIFPKGQ